MFGLSPDRLNLTFDQPKRIIFGMNTVEQAGKEMKKMSAHRILLVTDQNVEKSGLSGRVQKVLENEGSKVDVYDRISAEPTMESVENAVKAAREASPDYGAVVGVGGGSVLDTTKMVASLLTNPGEPAGYLVPEDKFTKPSVPKILIPTTSGTGSEVSNYSVVIEKKTMYKTWAASSSLFADVAIVDPSMTVSCPPRVTAGSGIDVGGHNFEGLISREANPVSNGIALEAGRLLNSYLRRAYHSGDDLEARSGMALASMFGGMVITFPWVGGPAILGHCLAEAFGPKYNVPHGIAVGVSLPYILEFNASASPERVASIAPALAIKQNADSIRQVAEKVPKKILELMKDVELPRTLKQVNFPKADLESFAGYIVNERQYFYNLPRFNPRRLTLDNVVQLLHDMYEGALEA